MFACVRYDYRSIVYTIIQTRSAIENAGYLSAKSALRFTNLPTYVINFAFLLRPSFNSSMVQRNCCSVSASGVTCTTFPCLIIQSAFQSYANFREQAWRFKAIERSLQMNFTDTLHVLRVVRNGTNELKNST